MLMIAAGSIAALAVIVFMVGLVGSQRGEKAIYYAARRAAHRTASRLYSWSLWCLGLAVALFIASRVLPTENLPTALPPPITPISAASTPVANTATSIPTTESPVPPTEQPAPTPIPASDSATPIVTASSLPTKVILAIATPTLAPEDVPLTVVPIITAVRPIVITVLASDKPLTLRAVSSSPTGNGQSSSTTEFGNGIPTVYVIFDYRNIPRGTILGQVWLRNGASVSASTAKFAKPGAGTDMISWTPKGGFTPGLYEVRIMLANTPQFTANFLVK